jgi:hypothetical protein
LPDPSPCDLWIYKSDRIALFVKCKNPLEYRNEVGHFLGAVFLDSFRALVCFFGGTKADPLVETALLLLSLSRAGFGCSGNNQSLENAGDHPGRGKGGVKNRRTALIVASFAESARLKIKKALKLSPPRFSIPALWI